MLPPFFGKFYTIDLGIAKFVVPNFSMFRNGNLDTLGLTALLEMMDVDRLAVFAYGGKPFLHSLQIGSSFVIREVGVENMVSNEVGVSPGRGRACAAIGRVDRVIDLGRAG
jgi:hypothetical protein